MTRVTPSSLGPTARRASKPRAHPKATLAPLEIETPAPAPVLDVAGFSGDRLARIDDFLRGEIAARRIPGAVLHIERHGEIVTRQAWGYRDATAGTLMTPDAIFRIYSMTKPIVSIATMILAAEGRLHLDQPVSDFIPAFARAKLLRDGALVAPSRAPTVHDLLRHTSGLTYQSNGGAVGALYAEAGLMAADLSNAAFAETIAALPLAHEPGRVWEYGHSTDVLGRVVEVAAGGWALSAVLTTRVLAPLGMYDTGFFVANEMRHDRIAEPFPDDTIAGRGALFDPRHERAFEAGGMGLVSTVDDYARFARMLLGGGALGKTMLVAPRTLRFMASDHIGPGTGVGILPSYMPGPGFGFGLGFAVRRETGAAGFPGSVGEFNWSGVGGTTFWIDPVEDMFVILLTQSPRQRLRLRAIIKTMVYDAMVDAPRR
jgi:CubicO group peptidase (beta-lactamase class C family)